MVKYAKGTTVSISRSVMEINRILKRYDVKEFQIVQGHSRGGVQFTYDKLPISMVVDIPPKESDAEKRRLWRVLVLHLKSALELDDIRLGNVRPILNYVALGGGRVMADLVADEVKVAVETGKTPKAFGLLGDGK